MQETNIRKNRDHSCHSSASFTRIVNIIDILKNSNNKLGTAMSLQPLCDEAVVRLHACHSIAAFVNMVVNILQGTNKVKAEVY